MQKLKDLFKTQSDAESILFAAFAAAEVLIYLLFNILCAVLPHDTIYLKYSGILLCLAFSAAMIFFTREDKDSLTLTLAFIFTAISDLFILVINDYYEIGLVTFILTQSAYFYRLYRGRRRMYISLFARIAGMGVLLAIMVPRSEDINLLLVLVCIYIVMLFANCVDAWVVWGAKHGIKSADGLKSLMFAVGLVLFLCCDICVGLDNAGAVIGLKLPIGLARFVNKAIWPFYLPSQALIALSYCRGGLNKKEVDDERKVEKSA